MGGDGPLVLVVEDDETLQEILGLRIRDWGFETHTAATLEEATGLLGEHDFDVVVADLVLPDAEGLDLLDALEDADRSRPVILITAHGSVDLAVEAMKRGATDFLTKPLDFDKLRALVEAAESENELRTRIRSLEEELESGAGLGLLVGTSEPMQEVYRLVELLAGNDASAILTGESGTGKEVVARTVHRLSERADGPFVALNAAAIPEGLVESELFGHEKGAFTGATESRPGCFENADGGILLLDEISEMPTSLQPKLLRVLEDGRVRRVGGSREKQFDVRVLAATNRDLEEAVEEGQLREDLFYRLNVFEVHLPPLRERRSDIPLLVQHFVRSFNEKHELAVEGFRDAALERLSGYRWPGNVRELRNVVERAVIVAGQGMVGADDLPPYLDDSEEDGRPRVVVPIGTTAREAEKELILKTLEHVDNNKAEAARQLDLDPKTIRNKLKRWDEGSSAG